MLAFDILYGVLVAIALSVADLMIRVARPHDAIQGIVPGLAGMHDVDDYPEAQTIPGLVVYRFYGPLIFANVRFFIERLEYFIARASEPVRQIIVDARAIPEVDVTAAEVLRVFAKRMHERGIRMVIAKAHLPLREAALRLGLQDALSGESYYPKLSDAVKAFEQETGPKS